MLRAILIGAPGAGKSTVGKALSRELSTSFEDTDAAIVAEVGKSVSEIFAEKGEAGFRAIEREVVLRVLRSNKGIVALGGGAVLDPLIQNEILASAATVIYLRVGIGNVVSRISNRTDRPLLSKDPEKEWLILFAQREAIYKKLATIEVSTDNKKAHEVARELVGLMGLFHG